MRNTTGQLIRLMWMKQLSSAVIRSCPVSWTEWRDETWHSDRDIGLSMGKDSFPLQGWAHCLFRPLWVSRVWVLIFLFTCSFFKRVQPNPSISDFYSLQNKHARVPSLDWVLSIATWSSHIISDKYLGNQCHRISLTFKRQVFPLLLRVPGKVGVGWGTGDGHLKAQVCSTHGSRNFNAKPKQYS